MIVGSLFSGIGGFDLGLQRAGLTASFQCEIDPKARQVLDRWWPFTPTYPDVKELSRDALAADPGRLADVDVLCGGFPCQDLSVAGRRRGLAGEQSGLFHEFMRLAGELAPRWVLIENVPGLLSSDDGRDMGVVLGTLGELGYGWAYRILDAQYFGVAQRRRRVFIVGCAGDAASAAAVLFEPQSCDGDSPPSRQAREAPAGTLGGGAGERGWSSDTDRMTFVPEVAPTMLGFGGPRGTTNNPNFVDGSVMALPLIARTVTTSGKRYDGDTDTFIPTIGFQGTNGIDPCPSVEVSPPIKVGSGLGISSPPDVAYRKAQKAHDPDDCERWEQDDLATTIDASGHGPRTAQAVVSEMAVRRLTPTECERLQGFPDGWTDGQPDSARYRQLGNAVCVPVAEWIGRGLMLVAHKEEVA